MRERSADANGPRVVRQDGGKAQGRGFSPLNSQPPEVPVIPPGREMVRRPVHVAWRPPGGMDLTRAYGQEPSTDAAMAKLRRNWESAACGTAGASAPGVSGEAGRFQLVVFLITEGTEDCLHATYMQSYVELDRAGGRTLLFQDIGHPSVKGPTLRALIKGGYLTDDPGDVELYEKRVAAAGGEVAYRRQEIDRLRKLLGLEEEPPPFLVFIPTSIAGVHMVLPIPESILSDPTGPRRLWRTLQESLSESVLRPICAELTMHPRAASPLADLLNDIHAQLVAGESVVRGSSLVEKDEAFELTFAGRSVVLRQTYGARYLHGLLSAPRRDDGSIVVEALSLWREEHPNLEIADDAWDPEESALLDGGGIETVDRMTVRQLKSKYKRMLKASKEAEEAGRLGKAQQLDQEAEKIEKYLGENLRVGGRPRILGGHNQRVVDSVRKAIKRETTALARVHPAASEHFVASVRVRGGEVIYWPASPQIWAT
jgi:hypothetical protein